MIRAAIIDDEPMARRIIRKQLSGERDVEVIGECRNGLEAAAFIRKQKPDLVFLDVQMPGMDGFTMLAGLDAAELPAVVFVTAYEEYAIAAFENQALDYLLKPFTRERFARAMERARRQLARRALGEVEDGLVQLLREAGARHRYLSRLSVRISDRILLIPVEEISWFEGSGSYVRLHAGEKSYLCREHLNALEARLDPSKFMRVQRSAIVRIDMIGELQHWFHGQFVIVLKDGTRLKSGRNYGDKIKTLL